MFWMQGTRIGRSKQSQEVRETETAAWVSNKRCEMRMLVIGSLKELKSTGQINTQFVTLTLQTAGNR